MASAIAVRINNAVSNGLPNEATQIFTEFCNNPISVITDYEYTLFGIRDTKLCVDFFRLIPGNICTPVVDNIVERAVIWKQWDLVIYMINNYASSISNRVYNNIIHKLIVQKDNPCLRSIVDAFNIYGVKVSVFPIFDNKVYLMSNQLKHTLRDLIEDNIFSDEAFNPEVFKWLFETDTISILDGVHNSFSGNQSLFYACAVGDRKRVAGLIGNSQVLDYQKAIKVTKHCMGLSDVNTNEYTKIINLLLGMPGVKL